ncbi:MAG: hypothetical protein KKB30_15345 [Proteobacteria bacterium]|nr:hypothetical protein [Pseudomonadota bacterium]MBU1716300.1 hypothetical protein [Pseudomonadota bacterium]
MSQVSPTSDSRKKNPQSHLKLLKSPALLMQAEPRQVVTANQKAGELFGKNLENIAGHRGGEVFDCVHSFTEAGCGKDPNCENCKIKNAVVETFTSGKSHNNVRTILDIRKHNKITPYDLQISTKKITEYVIMTIDTFRARTSDEST